MKPHQKIRVLEEEYQICKRNLQKYVSEYKAANRMPIRDKASIITDLEFQITIFYKHLASIQDDLIKAYWKARQNASTA